MTQTTSANTNRASGAPDPLIGRTVNERFKVTALIARGGMGKVYRAEQAPLGRVCAVKVLNPNYAGDSDPEFHKRFFLEASIASKLTHPNTVTIFDYGRTDDDIYYMAMEYLEGVTLHRAIREAGHFPEERAAHVARQMCRALREAHSLGVIHRDLKPANIFLVQHGDENDFVKVLDFGLVKDVSDKNVEELTQAGLFMGSPKYMAPEQIRGERVDARTDIYALGVIMYEMITGKVPFDRPNSVNILMAHVNEEVPPLRTMNPAVEVSPDFEALLFRCMAKEADQRFRSMDELLAALKRAGGGAMTATVSIAGTGEYRTLSSSGGHAITASGANVVAGQRATSSGAVNTIGVEAFAPPQAKSKAPLIGAVVGGVVLLGVIAAFAMKGKEPPKPPPQTATTASTTTATATPTATIVATAPPTGSGPSSPDLVKVRVTTDPEGASVKEDGVEVCSATPCQLQYRGAEADPNREHKLSFLKGGFKNEDKTIKIGDSPVSVKLTRVAFQGAAPNTGRPNAVPTGYIEVPY